MLRTKYPPLDWTQELNTRAREDVEYDAIIIGGGVGGLTAAAQMVSNGAKVLVLEKYLIPGGSAAHFKRDGYTFDVGSSMMFGFGDKGTTNLLSRALQAVGKTLDTVPDPTQVKYHLPASKHFPQGLKIQVGRSREEFYATLIRAFPHEAKGIKAFYDECWAIFSCLNVLELKSLEEPLYLAGQFFQQPLACLQLVPYLTANTGDVARRHIRDPQLLGLIDAECFVFSTVPASHTPMINAGMVLSDRFFGHINYPRGGVGKIPQALAEGVVEYGGSIVYKARVKQILTEGKGDGMKAVGVRLADGRVFRGKSLISNATRWDTFEGMMGEERMPTSERLFRQRYRKAPSFFSLHLGVRADALPNGGNGLDVHHIILEDWKKLEDPHGLVFVSMPSIIDPSVAPPGRHVVHAFTADFMDAWQGLDAAEYEARKEAAADAIIARLERALGAPGLRDAIELKEIGTPRTHRRYLGRPEGTYGPIPSRRPMGIVGMPFNRTTVQGLYCVGDSTFPGQGVNAVAMSGIGCAHRVMVDLGMMPALPKPVDDAFTSTLQFFRDRA